MLPDHWHADRLDSGLDVYVDEQDLRWIVADVLRAVMLYEGKECAGRGKLAGPVECRFVNGFGSFGVVKG